MDYKTVRELTDTGSNSVLHGSNTVDDMITLRTDYEFMRKQYKNRISADFESATFECKD